MNQKGISTLVIAVIVVVVIAVVGVGVYLYMSGSGGNGGGGGATPTPTASDVGSASSLQFSVEVTSEGESYTNKYWAKNIGTSDMMIRVEIGDVMVYVLNGADEEAWSYMAGEWTDLSDTFSDEWDQWDPLFASYQDSLADWTGTGEWSYTEDGTTVRIFGISVNQPLADSLFQPE